MRARLVFVAAASSVGLLAAFVACGPSYRKVADPMAGSAAILPSPVLAEEVPTSPTGSSASNVGSVSSTPVSVASVPVVPPTAPPMPPPSASSKPTTKQW